VFLLILPLGKVSTFLKEADLVFLLPKTVEMKEYLVTAYKRSVFLPIILAAATSFILLPLILLSTGGAIWDLVYYFLLVLFAKLSFLWTSLMEQFYHERSLILRLKTSIVLLYGVSLASMLFIHFMYTGLLFILFFFYMRRVSEVFTTIDWVPAVHLEKKRIMRIYKVINLFTDVPDLSNSVKRRKVLDGFTKLIRATHEHTYQSLYLRAFLRGSEFLPLVCRLLFIGGLAIFFLDDQWMILCVGLLFLYLAAFQLLPLYSQFQYVVFTHLYPVSKREQSRDFSVIIAGILLFVSIAYSLLAIKIGMMCLVFPVASILLGIPYTQYRIRKQEKR
jgi:ABC-2 type transport system permease protein